MQLSCQAEKALGYVRSVIAVKPVLRQCDVQARISIRPTEDIPSEVVDTHAIIGWSRTPNQSSIAPPVLYD
jgi:hypothetical protein